MGRVTESLSYRVKSTFVEIGGPSEAALAVAERRGTRRTYSGDASDGDGAADSDSRGDGDGLGARPGREVWRQTASPSKCPVVPNTPSPFMHPAVMKDDGTGWWGGQDDGQYMGNGGMAQEMSLPPAYGDGPEGFSVGVPPAFGNEGMGQSYEGQDIYGFYGVPAMVYDPATDSYNCGWCMPIDALGHGAPNGGGEGEGCGGGMSNGDMPMEAIMEGQGVNFDGAEGMNQGDMPLEGIHFEAMGSDPAPGVWAPGNARVLRQGDGCNGMGQWDMSMEAVMDGHGGHFSGADGCGGMGPSGAGMEGMLDGQQGRFDGERCHSQGMAGGADLGWNADGADHGRPVRGKGNRSNRRQLQAQQAAQQQQLQAAAQQQQQAAQQQQQAAQQLQAPQQPPAPPQAQQEAQPGAEPQQPPPPAAPSRSESQRSETPSAGPPPRRAAGEAAARDAPRAEPAAVPQQPPQAAPREPPVPQQPQGDRQRERERERPEPQGPSSQPPQASPRHRSEAEREAVREMLPAPPAQAFVPERSESGSLQHMPPEMQSSHSEMSSPNGSTEVQTSSTEGIMTPSGGYTTVMLRNIPNKYTREMLVKQLSQDFRGRFDFVYLPIDFKNRCNVGYGFINFRTVEACAEFVGKFNGVDVRKCLPGLNSRKVAEVTPARVQGLDENVRRLRNGPVMNELVQHPDWMPLLLDEVGEEKVFPLPDQPCPPVKPRRRTGGGREEPMGGAGSTGRGGW